jgi:hypothetical protein
MAAGHSRGGRNLGLAPITLAWTIAILGFAGYLAVSRKDAGTPSPAPAPASHRHR